MGETILLCPRPLARYGGRFVLLPLLPPKPPLKPLPVEIWSKIFSLTLPASDASRWSPRHAKVTPTRGLWCVSLMLVCKSFCIAREYRNVSHSIDTLLSLSGRFCWTLPFANRQVSLTLDLQEVASPLLYSNVKLFTVNGLDKFSSRLRTADQLWDSIRRIPYSAPGRWVHTFDLSGVTIMQTFVIDSLLTTLFPLMPFMENLTLPALPLSRRALASLISRDGGSNLRILGGVCYAAAFSSAISVQEDPLVQLLQACHCLERLEVIGNGLEPVDVELDSQEAVEIPAMNAKLVLPRLHTLTLLSVPSSSLMHALLNAALPRLRTLYVTPYDDIPYPRALTTQFIDTHGSSLSTLSFFTPKSWPTRFHPSPRNLLHTCPNLLHLSLETPLPALLPPVAADSGHVELPLQILSIPRPNHDIWRTLEALFPSLPSLNIVRMRDVRWLRRGLNHHAQEAGVQGEMRVWRQRLAKRGICLLDGDWKDAV